jgi:ribose transport system ATP-binding protein
MLSIQNVSKTFPGVKALHDVSVEMHPGEIHALLGENGAGKSTLIKIISGLYKPDPGSTIIFDGEKYAPHNTYDAISKGIHTVYQHLSAIAQASVAENIMLDKLRLISRHGVIRWKDVNEKASEFIKLVGLNIDPKKKISELSVAQRQLLEIAKAVASENKILLLDEPTASLTESETKHLFTITEKLKSQGVLIVFVTHILEEVLEISDKITILRDGACVITEYRSNLDQNKIINYMIGRNIRDKKYNKAEIDPAKKILEVRDLTLEKKAYDINFTLYEGEILGFYGLVGSGRSELAKILIGYDKAETGEVFVHGENAKIHSIRQALEKYKLGYVSEDRRKDGLILSASLRTNITITVWKQIAKFFGVVTKTSEDEITDKQVKGLNIKTTGFNQKVNKLSGGNQQKVNFGKWLAAATEILIIDEPTVGVDVGAKEYFEELIINLSAQNKSIILISSDMPEIVRLAHRILVFSGNRIVGEIDNSESNYEKTSKKISEYISEFNVVSE